MQTYWHSEYCIARVLNLHLNLTLSHLIPQDLEGKEKKEWILGVSINSWSLYPFTIALSFPSWGNLNIVIPHLIYTFAYFFYPYFYLSCSLGFRSYFSHERQ